MNWIYPLYICEILLFFIAFLLSKQDIMAPSVIMCVMFIISTTVAIFAADQVQIKLCEQSFVILISGMFVFVTAVSSFQLWFQRDVTRTVRVAILQNQQVQSFSTVHIQNWLIIVAIVMDVVILTWYMWETLRIFGAFGAVVRTAITQNTVTSWNDAIYDPILTQLMKIVKALGYISGFVLIQRFLAKEKGFFQAIGLLLLVILSLVQAATSGSRGEILQLLTALLAEYNILWHQKNGWNRNLSWKLIRIGLLCIAIGIPLFCYAVVWMGRTSRESMRTMTETINIYVGYPIYLFDLYVKDPSTPIVFGEESLIGVNTFLNKFFGMDVFVRNVNLETRYSNGYFLGNVYTFFRRPLHDFGFWGMLIFTVLVALLFSWIYYGKIKWRSRTVGTDCWSMIYGYLFYWIVASSIAQNSQTYISLNVLIFLLAIVVGYHLLNGIVITTKGLIYRKRRTHLLTCIRIRIR